MTDTDSAPIVYLPDGTPVRVRLIGATCEGDVSGEGHYGYYPQDLDGEDPTVYFEAVPLVECVHCDDEIAQAHIEEHHVTEHPMERWNPAYYPEVFEDDELRADGGVSVFEDGTATTCPDCEGDLQYQNREAIVCLDCGTNYVHWKTTAEHQLREVEVETGESETVATAPVEDGREIRTDGGVNESSGTVQTSRQRDVRKDGLKPSHRYVRGGVPVALGLVRGVLGCCAQWTARVLHHSITNDNKTGIMRHVLPYHYVSLHLYRAQVTETNRSEGSSQ